MSQSIGSSRLGRLGKALSAAILLLACIPVSPAAAAGGAVSRHSSGSNGDAYILALGDDTTSTNISVEEHARIRGKRSGDFLWFRRAGKTYLIEDPATLEQARALFAPLHALEPEFDELRRTEEALNDKEQELDRQDEELDRQMERLNGDDADEGDDNDEVYEEGAEAAAPVSDADREELRRQFEELRSQQQELQGRQRDVESANRDLDRAERALDAREDAVEREAEAKLWALIDAAIKSGTASPSPTP